MNIFKHDLQLYPNCLTKVKHLINCPEFYLHFEFSFTIDIETSAISRVTFYVFREILCSAEVFTSYDIHLNPTLKTDTLPPENIEK